MRCNIKKKNFYGKKLARASTVVNTFLPLITTEIKFKTYSI